MSNLSKITEAKSKGKDEDKGVSGSLQPGQKRKAEEHALPDDVSSNYTTSEDDEPPSSEGSDQNSENGDELVESGIVNVDFDFSSPQEGDFHSIKRMLQVMFDEDAVDFNLSELADMIIDQPHVGTVVKADGTDDLYAFISDKGTVKQIRDYLLGKSERFADAKAKQTLARLLDPKSDKHVGLLINERFVNMPPHIVPPLLRLLFEEMEEAVKKGEPFKFEWYLLLSPVYRTVRPSEDAAGEVPDSAASGKDKAADISCYYRAEDELIEPLVDSMFEYQLTRYKRQSDSRDIFSDSGLKPCRRCFIIHHTKLRLIYDKLKQALKIE
ncbi:Mss4p nuclear export [Spiromyces aspiralis]|uniref:Mss4p nuclear export n=1 Tax=Spiromyces aspiralis TaxID=68401 RepID=A0ACC1HVB3_9FUNG|nr:Mss4p nuclear export [Spiromyces aspiralis]